MPSSRFPSFQSKPADSLQTDSVEARDDQIADAASRRNPDAAILDPDRLPTWQRPFVLGPNVRFTRTPHRKHPEPEARLASGEEPSEPSVELSLQSPAVALQDRIADELPAGRDVETGQSHMNGIPGGQEPPVAVDFLFRPICAPEHEVEAEVPAILDAAHVAEQDVSNKSFEASEESKEIISQESQIAEPEAEAPAQMARQSQNNETHRQDGCFAFIPDGLAFEMMGLGLFRDGGETQADAAGSPEPAPEMLDGQDVLADRVDDAVEHLVDSEESWTPLTAHSDVVEAANVTSEPEAPGNGPSPIELYRQVLLHSPLHDPLGKALEPEAEDVPVSLEDAATLFDESVATASDGYEAGDDPVEDLAGQADDGICESEPESEGEFEATTAPLHVLTKQEETDFLFPSIELLQSPSSDEASEFSQEALEQSAGLLESILEDFGVKGEIIDVRPGPVVTLYEFEPAPGVKSSRVINLSDDIARSMSALSARVAVIPGRNVIGIELPNEERETVYLRELFESRLYMTTDFRLPLCLGKNIGGEPVVAELAKMPHLLVAGTTGSGKSVAINTMILSLLYHLRPEECRLIMVDPKMLELSVYDGIPHLLTPVVTDPKKAVLALKWAVREMEDRYRKMSRLGVRNIDGFNKRVAEARSTGETIMVSVPTGFDRTTGEQTFEEQELDLSALPYIVVIVDEMADLMMVAGKEIEGTIQRLAQMARAAGIHLIMATQRPSVDVITGTIKANFPTRISFQVTSKIDSRTILGEQGAEYLLGQGDMLHMKGGGRIARVHGPFVSDYEVEKVVAHLKTQGTPTYLGSVVVDDEEDEEGDEDAAVFDATDMGAEGDDSDDLFAKAVRIVQRDKKCSTSYIQRRLSIGYNRAASLVERMEQEGLVGPANHVGKREILDPPAAG